MRILAALLAITVAASAAATDLVNKDGVAYSATIISGEVKVRLAISAKSAKLGVCASTALKCIVSIDGVGEIEVTGADDVVIRGGRLSKK